MLEGTISSPQKRQLLLPFCLLQNALQLQFDYHHYFHYFLHFSRWVHLINCFDVI